MANGRAVFIILGILLGTVSLLLLVRRLLAGMNEHVEIDEQLPDTPTEELVVQAE
jgi:hypothetical protein